jgi:chemotaxis protein MotB
MKSKKRHGSEQAAPDLVMVMTISLFIILLAFFILLNSIAVVDDQKKLGVLDSLIGNFGVLTGGKSVLEGKGGTMGLPDMEQMSSHIDFSDLTEGAEDLIRLVRIRTDPNGTALTVPEKALFEKGDFHLTAAGKKLLDRMCGTFQKNQYPVQIVAHTDNLAPEPGLGMTNRVLSTLQAGRILEYLIREKGLEAKRFTAWGWGQYRPLVSNQTRETREMNRRIELVFVHERSTGKPKGIFTFRKFFFHVLD